MEMMRKMMSEHTLMQKAKARMLMKHVFFATLVMSTKLIAKKMRTAGTDMISIFYDPEFIEGLKDADLVLFVLAHEVMHIVLKHGLRRGGRNHVRWNIACDFAINLMLKKAGFKIWEKALLDPRYEGMSAEQIYELREKEREDRIKKGKKIPLEFGAGSPGNGVPDNGCDQPHDDGFGDDVLEPGDLTPDEQDAIERHIGQMVAQASSMARMAGKMSGDLERLVNQVLNPPAPWRQLLREYMTAATPNEEDWRRRNRRFTDYVLPGKWSEAMGEVVIIGDTSGSMGDDVFGQIATEINEIREQVNPERVRVIWADDSDCNREEVFEKDDLLELRPKGGGGTDMRKPLKFVEKYEPVVCILVTDGYTPWPDEEPPYPLIVMLTEHSSCPVGRVIQMER